MFHRIHSHNHIRNHIRTVNQTLEELGVSDKPTLLVFNKIDLYREENYDPYIDMETREEIEEGLKGNLRHLFDTDNVLISAHTKENVEELRTRMLDMIKEQYKIRYPYHAKTW